MHVDLLSVQLWKVEWHDSSERKISSIYRHFHILRDAWPFLPIQALAVC